MGTISSIFGTGKDRNILPMTCRAMVIFVVCLSLIRIPGKTIFGVRGGRRGIWGFSSHCEFICPRDHSSLLRLVDHPQYNSGKNF